MAENIVAQFNKSHKSNTSWKQDPVVQTPNTIFNFLQHNLAENVKTTIKLIISTLWKVLSIQAQFDEVIHPSPDSANYLELSANKLAENHQYCGKCYLFRASSTKAAKVRPENFGFPQQIPLSWEHTQISPFDKITCNKMRVNLFFKIFKIQTNPLIFWLQSFKQTLLVSRQERQWKYVFCRE